MKTMQEDFYKVLGIQRDATEAEIHKAYRELARKYHPDLNPDDDKAKKKFQQVQQAHEVLSDKQKRADYDQFGHAAFGGPGAGPDPFSRRGPGGARSAAPNGPASPNFQDIDLTQFFGGEFSGGSGGIGDIFRQFSRGGRGAPRGNDLFHELKIDFRTSIEGGEAAISVRREDGRSETITVKIPEGIEDGKKIRLRGQGAPSSAGGARGDIMIVIRVEKHPWFTRRGDDLDVRVPLTLAEAAAGTSVDIPTPKGTISIKVPPCTSGGTKLRVKGHGVRRKGNKKGDLYAEIMIVMPEKLTDQQLTWIKQLNGAASNPRTNLRW